ncbi:succinyl-diaminopimelate desuccinylase [Oceaniovalibus guishaninsula JLT2003]|uniref:Succinyl-diaminopimelate desuccinylase n=1 Tax=Oceaniovalibus guishaninsula JLT2003 TaxID=1231392 RepID=K2HQ90_9RHOB|nr:succinyl-diaminopimelate desuccinylase [Oceaniovalibus guishaninsula]EKE44999.1 succinyl-diaminopimelate desuccinylase [Oceaniovalibus guishaninsula JLT2003]
MIPDSVDLTAALIRCRSVTPADGGAVALLADLLSAADFVCTRCDRNGIANLHARWGTAGPVIGFNGHTDVVPVGDPAAWTHDPFGGVIADGRLHGRGAQDMKSGVAAFVCAAIAAAQDAPRGSIVLTITGDEEGDGMDGTRAILDWMAANGQTMDACIVGEPTCPTMMGEMVKIGRRGSMTGHVTCNGRQGHAAYPHLAVNPVHALSALVGRLTGDPLDEGTEAFDPSTVQVTGFETGNAASNVIPATARAMVNVRFNDAHRADDVRHWAEGHADWVAAETGARFDWRWQISGEAFVTPPGPLSDLVVSAVEAETGRRPVLSTSGGTSDARFVKDICPVIEVGLVGDAMHQTDESVPVDQIVQLTAIYRRIVTDFLA